MSKVGEQKFLSGAANTLGPLVPQGDVVSLDPAQYRGCLAINSDGVLYISDGFTWKVPADDAVISRPIALMPTNAIEQTQLRLTPFYSAKGLMESGIFFEVSLNNDFVNGVYFSRNVVSSTASLYQVLTPEDGIAAEQTFWWRAAYKGRSDYVTERQSEFSTPFQQTFPKLISTPAPVTREGATTGSVEITPFESPFSLNPVQVQVEYTDATTGSLLYTQTVSYATAVPVPSQIAEGVAFKWRARYSGRVGLVGAVSWSDWSVQRTAVNGARSILLEFDLQKQGSRTINLPIGMHLPGGGVVNVTVNWGDGTSNTYTTGGAKAHTYAAGIGDVFNVSISGTLSQYGGAVTNYGLTRINAIGMGLGLTSLQGLFRGTNANLVFVNPALPPTVTNLSEAFQSVGAVGFDVGSLDVSYTQNMSYMFQYSTINPNISGWNTSSATNMSYMFYSSAFNSGIPSWNTSNVTNMSHMFDSCPFNQPIGNWDVSKVTDMSYMFWNAGASTVGKFNQPIGNWNTGNVTNMKGMLGMQHGRYTGQDFNQNIGAWDVSKVTDMSLMFGIQGGVGGGPGGGTGFAFNNGGSADINNWNTSSVTTMRGMFGDWDGTSGVTAGFNYHKFNQPITNWKTGNVTDMSYMFSGNNSFQKPLTTNGTGWDVSKVTNMQGMFRYSYYNQPITNWGTTSLTNMVEMFRGAASFNNDVSGLNTAQVTSFYGLFYDASNFNHPSINTWNTANVTSFSQMFRTSQDRVVTFNQPLNNWNTGNVTDMSYMFSGTWNTTHAFNQDISMWNTSKVTTMESMFGTDSSGRQINFNQPLDTWDVSKVANMNRMFYNDGGYGKGCAFNQSLAAWNLNPSGVQMTNIFGPGTNMSAENYSRTLAGWANKVAQRDGPYSVSMSVGGRSYNTTEYFPAERFKKAGGTGGGREFLVGSRALSVSGATDANGNGSYPFVTGAGLYTNAQGWYFAKNGSTWELRDASNVVQAAQTSATNVAAPQFVTTWNGVLSAATVLRTGAVWTITGDTAV